MIFNSYVFVFLFLPIFLLGWFCLNRYKQYKLASAWVVAASFVFCAYVNISYLIVLIGGIAANYAFYLWLKVAKTSAKRKAVLSLGLVVNIGALLVFKYTNFFLSNINDLFGTDIVMVKLILPLGISFYTFHQISFLIDTYRGEISECSLLDFALYISYFPKLSMGPIVRYNDLMSQFGSSLHTHTHTKSSIGIIWRKAFMFLL